MGNTRALGIMSFIFSAVAAVFAVSGTGLAAAGFAIAAGIAGMGAGWRKNND